MANTSGLQAIHQADDAQVDIYRSQIQDAGGRYCFSGNVEIRKVDGKDVIVDGLNRAVACHKENVNARIEYVSENEFLTDDDIRGMSFYRVSSM